MANYSELLFVFTKILLALTFIGSVGLLAATVLYSKHTRAEHALCMFILSIAGWSAALFVNLFSADPLIEESMYAFSILSAGALTWLAYTFPDVRPTRLSITVIMPSLFFALLVFLPGFLFKGFSLSPEGYTEAIGGAGYYIFHTLFFAYLCLAIIKIYSRRSESKNATLRQQFMFLAISILGFAAVKFAINIVLSGFYGISFLNTLTPMMALIPAITTYAIIRQYYYVDLRYILYGLIGKISLFLLAGLTYLLSLLVIGTLARGHNILTYHIAFIITMLSTLELSPILSREAVKFAAGPREKANAAVVQHYIIDLFEQQHTTVEIANATMQLCSDMLNARKSILITQATGNERDLLLLQKVRENGSSYLDEPTILLLETSSLNEIGLPDKKEKLGEELRNIFDAALVATLSSQHILYGLLILGERKDGRGYSKQDVMLIQNILLPLSSALAEATFRSKITLLTSASDNETGKLREQVFARSTRSTKLLEELRTTTHDSLHTLRHKFEAIRAHGPGATDAAMNALEKSSLLIEQKLTQLYEEQAQPIVTHMDIAPLIHKLIEHFGARALIGESHLSYEIPENVPIIGDSQQIYEALTMILQDIFAGSCSKGEKITFNVALKPNTVEIMLYQEFNQANEPLSADERSRRERCLSAHENPQAIALIEHNGGTMRELEHSATTARTLITLQRDTSEDSGGIAA